MSRLERILPVTYAVALGAGLAMLAAALGRLAFPLDDAYIYLQYARTAAEGHPFRYAAGEPLSTGATSLGWMLLVDITALLAKGLRAPLPALVLGLHALTTAGTLLFSYRIARRLGASLAGAGVVVPVLLVSPLWFFGWFNGMETGLYGLALLAAVWAVLGGSPLWLILLPLARPEGAAIAVGLLLWLAWSGRGSSRRRLPPILVLLATVLALVWPWLLTGHGAAGWAAKALLTEPNPVDRAFTMDRFAYFLGRVWWFGVSGTAQQPPLGLSQVFLTSLAWPAWAAAGFLGGGVLLLSRRKRVAPVLVWMGASGLALTAIAWDAQQYRYLIAAYPLLVTAAAAGWFGSGTRRPAALRTGLGLLVLAATLAGAALDHQPFWERARWLYRGQVETLRLTQMHVGEFVATALPPEARVATHDVGAIAYTGRRTVVDFVGLVTPEAAGAYRHGEGAMWEAMASLPPERRPTHAAIVPSWMPYLYRTLWFETRVDGAGGPRRQPKSREFEVWRLSWPAAPTWPGGDFGDRPAGAAFTTFGMVDRLDVADLRSEHEHGFRTAPRDLAPGEELTMVRDLGFDPELSAPARAHAIDGGRTLEGTTTFTLDAGGRAGLVLVLRTASPRAATLTFRIRTSERDQEWTREIDLPGDESRFAETAVPIPPATGRLHITLDGPSLRLYNVWLLAGG